MSRAHRPTGIRPSSPEAAESPEWLPGKFDAGAAAARIARATPYRGGTIFRKAGEGAEAKDQGVDEEPAEDRDEKKKDAAGEENEAGAKESSGEEEAKESGPDEKPAEISAKLEGVGRKICLAGNDDPLLKLAKKYDLNLQSPTSRQILENLGMTCEAFIGAFRKGSLKAEFPREYLALTVQAALDADKTKVRKLLTDGRFSK